MFTWRAIYKDGSIHDYHPDNFNITHVDNEQLDLFQIKDAGGDVPILNIHFDDSRKRLIYIRRTEQTAGLPYPFITHLAGWQMKVNGENIQVINYVSEIVIVSWKGEPGKSEKVERHLHWIEQAGKFDRKRDSHFYSPSEKQLKIIGSNPK